MRVLVPFGSRRLTGFVAGVSDDVSERATKSIEHLLDDTPAFSEEMLKFTRWMADYYLCGWGDVLKSALPAGISLDERRFWVLSGNRDARDDVELGVEGPANDLLIALAKAPLTTEALRRRFHLQSASPEIRRLRKLGLIDYRPILRPPSVKTRFEAVLTLSDEALSKYDTTLFTGLRSIHQQQILRELYSHGSDGCSRSDLLKGATATRRSALSKLIELKWIDVRMEEANRWDPANEDIPDTSEPSNLTVHQKSAVAAISASIVTGDRGVYLLYGVTGSGKTQVYIEAIRRTLELGRTALVLLPEIALTPFVWGRFFRAFGDRVAIQHSAQSPSVRYDLWKRISEGKYPVVIGARSAVFAPLARLGLVVIDEEQETSFKQTETNPRYHARDAALMRARMEGAVAVLGSATPSMESTFLALQGKYKFLELPERVGGALMPQVEVLSTRAERDKVDAQSERAASVGASHGQKATPRETSALTPELIESIERVLASGRQVILLQNRRGYSPFLICRCCGHLFMCPNCSVSLTYHRKGNSLRCHYCDHRDAVPARCPECGLSEITQQGLGTQRLEDEFCERFPHARVLRMDSDTAARQGEHGRMVSAFAKGDYDVLIGTQMIAKGLDFPGVELAAIVRADAEFFFPDFRSTERGASLAVQLAGRAGRRERRGRVVIQTSVPDHPAIQTAVSGNWRSFAERELEARRIAGFPPFTKLILIRSVAKDESSGIKLLLRLRRKLATTGGLEILGPAPAVILKVENKFRFQMILRTHRDLDPSGVRLREAVKQMLTEYSQSPREPGVALEVDVDPVAVA